MRIKPVALIALRRLVGKRRVSRKDKERLFWLVESVWQAINRVGSTEMRLGEARERST
jgi:hypothetical protein